MPDKPETKPKAAPEPKAAKAADAPVAFTFTPIKPGDFLIGVPRRDLTAADVAVLSPQQLHDATAPRPDGTAMYTAVPAKEGDA